MDHWFHGDGGAGDELLADAEAFGLELPEAVFKPKEYELWPEHEDVVLMFLRCQTQWRAAMAGVMGLDYGVVFHMMDLYAVDRRQQLLEDLQVMEGRAMKLINGQVEKSMTPSSTSPKR